MALIEYNPFEGDGGSIASHRPTLEHVDGVGKENVPGGVPDPRYGVDARGYAVLAIAAVAAARVGRTRISVQFNGTTPTISHIVGLRDISSVDAFSVQYASGVTTILWPSGFLPPALTQPSAACNTTGFDHTATARNVSGGVEVRTGDGGAAAALAFTVEVG